MRRRHLQLLAPLILLLSTSLSLSLPLPLQPVFVILMHCVGWQTQSSDFIAISLSISSPIFIGISCRLPVTQTLDYFTRFRSSSPAQWRFGCFCPSLGFAWVRYGMDLFFCLPFMPCPGCTHCVCSSAPASSLAGTAAEFVYHYWH